MRALKPNSTEKNKKTQRKKQLASVLVRQRDSPCWCGFFVAGARKSETAIEAHRKFYLSPRLAKLLSLGDRGRTLPIWRESSHSDGAGLLVFLKGPEPYATYTRSTTVMCLCVQREKRSTCSLARICMVCMICRREEILLVCVSYCRAEGVFLRCPTRGDLERAPALLRACMHTSS